MNRIRIAAASIGAALALGGAHQAPARAAGPSIVPIDLATPVAPTPFRADGRVGLLYELHATNLGAAPIELLAIEVRAGDAEGPALATYRGPELADILRRPDLPGDGADRALLGAGLSTVAFLELRLGRPDDVPAALRHRLILRSAGADEIVEGANVEVRRVEPIVVGPPLRGAGWVAVNGPSNRSKHRRALIAVGGKARIAQRFAIDWIQLGADGTAFRGDPTVNANWYGYGAEVLAVADGVVTATRDGVPENVPTADERAVPITLETIGGNAVTLDLGGGRSAYFAHLQPGSLRVQVGERVRRGQVLGLLGNSGNSDAPHAHVHVTDAGVPASLGAEGLPHHIDAYELQGKLPAIDDLFEGKAWTPDAPPVRRQAELPLENDIVRFPEEVRGDR